MLTITPSAWDRLKEIQTPRPNVTAIRLLISEGRFKCGAGIQRNRDNVIQQEDRPTLLMSPGVSKRLSRRTLDVVQTKRGPRLRLQPPQSKTEV